MPRPSIRQLDQEAATDGQVVTFNATTGEYESQPAGEGTPAAQEREKRLFFGELSAYPNKGKSSSASEIQYMQIWILENTEISTMETFIVQGAASNNIRMGIYDQATPADLNGIPVDRVAQTNSKLLVGGDNGTFVTEALISNFTIPTTGYYWMALIVDSLTPQFAVTPSFRADYLPRREEVGTGTVLPAIAGTLTNPVSSAIYCAGIRI